MVNNMARASLSRTGEIGEDPVTSEQRCRYFSRSVSELPLPGHPHPIKVPVCRCVLTEVLIERLEAGEGNEEILSHLRGPALNGQPRPVIGADLKVISPATCTEIRLRERCMPTFATILTDLGLDATIPPHS